MSDTARQRIINRVIKKGIALGKAKSYLTWEEFNDLLPDNIPVDDLELFQQAIQHGLQKKHIDIRDEEVAEEPSADEDEDIQDEMLDEELKQLQMSEHIDDPVKIYLKQMGRVPLLTRAQEVEISKQIEKAE
jgi:RNA polymerase primary sigma factor